MTQLPSSVIEAGAIYFDPKVSGQRTLQITYNGDASGNPMLSTWTCWTCTGYISWRIYINYIVYIMLVCIYIYIYSVSSLKNPMVHIFIVQKFREACIARRCAGFGTSDAPRPLRVTDSLHLHCRMGSTEHGLRGIRWVWLSVWDKKTC